VSTHRPSCRAGWLGVMWAIGLVTTVCAGIRVSAQAAADTTQPADSRPVLKPHKLAKPRGPASAPAPGRAVPAPPPPTAAAPESVTVVPGPEYRASGIRRLFGGARYRAVWTTPIRVRVMDLERFAGGLTPLYHGGGEETVSLHMRGADGIEYVLRSIDKRPWVPANLRQTIVEDLEHDEISSALPTGALVVAPLLEAAGVLHLEPSLFVIPDDPRLGPYRQEFAGMLAEVEARPRTADGEETFAGASKVEGSAKLLAAMAQSSSIRADSRAFLTARLMDMYVGDFDRDTVQWRWARFGEKGDRRWEPIPLDRDWAFARFNGVLNDILSRDWPQIVVFGDHYPSVVRLAFEGWRFDRRLLQDLERPVFDSTAAWLVHQLSDSVIDAAVARLPEGERERVGPFLVRTLRRRRNGLPALAEHYYRRISASADVHSTVQPTVVDIDRRRDTVEIRFRLRDADPADPYFDRRFVRGETHEIRLYLDGGPDSIAVRGRGDGVLVRVIAAGDDDVLTVSSGAGAGRTAIYDGGHLVRLVGAHSISRDDRRWTPAPAPSDSLALGKERLELDDGSWCHTQPWLGGSTDDGLVVGGVLTCDAFGFRQDPSALHQTLQIAYGTSTGGGLLSYRAQLHPTESLNQWALQVRAATSEYTRYFGVGNETPLAGTLGFYEAHQQYYELAPAFVFGISRQASLALGPDLRYWETGRIAGTVLGTSRPYGVGPFGTIAGRLDFRLDTRDVATIARSGMLLDVSGRGVPDAWNATESYGQLSGVLKRYLSATSWPLEPTLVLRAGGMKVWGLAPYQDLAHIGAQTTVEDFSVRGYYPDRFTGDASAYGTVQLEITLAHPKLIVPADVGLLGLDDIGRVFAPGEPSSVWHDGAGGGVWAAWLDRTFASNVTVAHGTDGTRVYFGLGTGL